MHELKACIAKLLSDNFPAYEGWDADTLAEDCPAEEWGEVLAHVAYVIARDFENLETDRDDGDRFAAIVDGFAASVEECQMSRRCKADFEDFLASSGSTE